MATKIRLLSTYNGYKPQSIITVDDAIAAQLLFGGVNATTNLAGGTEAFKPAPYVGDEPLPSQAPGTRTIAAGTQTTIVVPAGVTVVLTGSSDVVGTREVLDKNGAVSYSTPLVAGSSLTAGPYVADTSVRLSVAAGTLSARTQVTNTLGVGSAALGPSVTVPAGSTDFVLKTAGNGALGDVLAMIKFTNTGTATTVTITDGDGTAYPDPSGTPGLIPNPYNAKVVQAANASTTAPPDYVLPYLGQASYNGPWKVTTGANVSLQVFGNFA